MRLGRRLPERFFARPALEVAPDLLGCLLVRSAPDGTRLVGRLVEVEAYLVDGTDASSHAHPGPTARNRSMFGPPGRLYAYLSYGIHTCVNVVCDRAGVGAAVLLRAVEPIAGEARMRDHRGLDVRGDRRLVASGPGRLAQAFALTLADDGLRLGGPALSIHRPAAGTPAPRIVAGPRIGITRAASLPYRFHVADDPFVSVRAAGRGPARSRVGGGRRRAARPTPT